MYPVKEEDPLFVRKAALEATPICIVLPYDGIVAAFPNIELPFKKVLYEVGDLTTVK